MNYFSMNANAVKRLFIQAVLALLCGSTAVFAFEAPASPRVKYNFNAGWKLFVGDPAGAQELGFNDAEWAEVTLPRAWNEDDAFRKDIKDLSTGVVWYRKHFKLPTTITHRKVFIEFEGIRHGGEFYLNGKLLGSHENGVMAFGFDLTDALRSAPEDNVLAVRVDNSWDYKEKATGSNYQWNDKNFYANYDTAGRKVSEEYKRTAGPPAGIRLTLHPGPGGLRADGADVALIDVEVVDASHNRCPTALNLINFSLSGPAEWRGGIAQGPENYILSRSLPVENGVNRIIIRSTPHAGKIVVSAAAEGLKPASVAIVSQPVQVTDGLSLELPSTSLSPYLVRGPTPPRVNLKLTRLPVAIAGVSAGAKAEQARLSFDDDETTQWTSDGQLARGWIKYELTRAARVSEITLKLANWRTRSYPIQIMVDEQVVFTGETPRSLGYVTLTFPPVTGRSLKIQLTARPKDFDAFGHIIEVTGEKDTDAPDKSKGTLAVVELEIYEAVGSYESIPQRGGVGSVRPEICSGY